MAKRGMYENAERRLAKHRYKTYSDRFTNFALREGPRLERFKDQATSTDEWTYEAYKVGYALGRANDWANMKSLLEWLRTNDEHGLARHIQRGAQTGAQAAKQRDPSKKRNKRVMNFLRRMRELRTSDPARYKRMIATIQKIAKKKGKNLERFDSYQAAELLSSNMKNRFKSVWGPPPPDRFLVDERGRFKKETRRDPSKKTFTVKFPPGAVKGMLSDALQSVLGPSSSRYKYHSSGSTVEFSSARQLKAVTRYLREARAWAMKDGDYDDLIPEIDEALRLISRATRQRSKRYERDPRRKAPKSKSKPRKMKASHPMRPYFAWVKKNWKNYQKPDGRLDMRRMWAAWKKHHA